MERSISTFFRILPIMLLAVSLTSCGTMPPGEQKPEVPHEAKAETRQQVELPTIVAVMPFASEAEEVGASERMRKSFYNFFSSTPYVDIELPTVDEGIVRLERRTGRHIADMQAQEICQAIGCDGLVFGKVVDYQKTFAGVFSRLRAEAEIWMVNAKTGKEVMRTRESVDYLEGGIPLTPLGIIMSALSSAANMRDIQETRMVSELSAKLVAKIPVPEGAPAVRRPVITELITNVGEGPFNSGKVVKVGLQGEPGDVGVFDIGNFKRGLPMRETQPGVYLGEYAVLPGDNTQDMPIIAYLKRPSGPESQWIDTSGLVAMDTNAPNSISDLTAKAFHDKIILSWGSLSDVPDLSGYQVLRSEHPLSGYEQIEMTELNTYEDPEVKPDTIYYYRIIAVDTSGNPSKASSTVSAKLATEEAKLATEEAMILSGELNRDTTLSGMYLLKGQFFVPRGVSLTIGPETTIVAENGARMRVQGSLTADGTDGLVRLFSRRAEKWGGIGFDGGHVTMKGVVLSGAQTALTLKDTEGVIENALLTDNDVGLYISGASGNVVKNCWVANNRIGIELTGTDATIVQSTIVRNGTGLSLRSFTGKVSENIIIDNEQNIFSDFPLKLDPNYIGLYEEFGIPQRGGFQLAGKQQAR